jgi:phosphatidylserine/phosphatidylglycerophosphate/cardiolipin synthase-like enzyme
LGARDSARAEFLPTEAFGDASLEAIAAARKRIWILAFYISGGLDPSIDAFYNTLRDKARAGLDVRIISEFGQGTPMPIRNGTANFTHTLLADGIQVGFIQEYRVMHKKVILVDDHVLFLGSSNLTGAGLTTSDEFNVRIESESMVRQAEADFLRLGKQMKSFEELE